jgi:hypothetical protein
MQPTSEGNECKEMYILVWCCRPRNRMCHQVWLCLVDGRAQVNHHYRLGFRRQKMPYWRSMLHSSSVPLLKTKAILTGYQWRVRNLEQKQQPQGGIFFLGIVYTKPSTVYMRVLMWFDAMATVGWHRMGWDGMIVRPTWRLRQWHFCKGFSRRFSCYV